MYSGKDCGTPPNPPANANVNTPSGTLTGESAVYSCDTGFQACDGCDTDILCNDTGVWDSLDPPLVCNGK